MKGRVSPAVAVILIAIVLAGVGLLGWKIFGGSGGKMGNSDGDQVVVKPDHPDDPKFKPNPNLGLAGGGG